MNKKKIFILYDGRAKNGDPDCAAEMDMASSEKEALKEGLGMWKDYDAIWYEYEIKVNSNILENGTPRYDLPPANQLKRRRENEKHRPNTRRTRH